MKFPSFVLEDEIGMGGGDPSMLTNSEADELLEELGATKGFIFDVIDYVDYGLEQIDNLNEPDERIREYSEQYIKSMVFDQIQDRLGDLIAAGKVDLDART